MPKYKRPQIDIAEADFVLLSGSGPGAGDIGSPSVDDNAKRYSIWDEVDNTYNINKEEQGYEDWE